MRMLIIALAVLAAAGCIQMRDYTGVKDGAFGLDVKKGFGKGKEKKDYYVIKDGEGIVVGDTKNEVITLMGIPDQVTTNLEGYECWVYEKNGVVFLFSEGKLKSWREPEKMVKE